MPVTFNLEAAMNGATLPYRWNPEYGARVGLLTREADADSTVWCELDDLCYVYHPLNAYDDGDKVVMDVAVHPKMFATDTNGPNEGPPTFERWTMDPATRRVARDLISDVPQEFPRGDERAHRPQAPLRLLRDVPVRGARLELGQHHQARPRRRHRGRSTTSAAAQLAGAGVRAEVGRRRRGRGLGDGATCTTRAATRPTS